MKLLYARKKPRKMGGEEYYYTMLPNTNTQKLNVSMCMCVLYNNS